MFFPPGSFFFTLVPLGNNLTSWVGVSHGPRPDRSTARLPINPPAGRNVHYDHLHHQFMCQVTDINSSRNPPRKPT